MCKGHAEMCDPFIMPTFAARAILYIFNIFCDIYCRN